MTIGAALLLLATILSLEVAWRLGILAAFALLGRQSPRATRLLLRTGVSEWAKERALRLMALKLLGLSIRAAAMLALVAAPLLLALLLDPVRRAWAEWPVRLWLLGLTSLYALVRRRWPRGVGDRALHHIALGVRPLLEASFDVERRMYGARADALTVDLPVFVIGLARAGTSVLTRALHAGGGFASLSYGDMPFPLAPNLWAALARRFDRTIAATERGHGDGLLHDLDSPEAIEEVFWRAYEGHLYCRADGLIPWPPRDETIAAFAAYVRLVLLRYGQPRYLSKNNANLLRLPALVLVFPDACLVHPFRDPLQQAASLLRQHRRAIALASNDPYRRRYMDWLGHHEFGAGRRPLLLAGGPGNEDSDGLDYWLRQWIGAYRSLLDQPALVAAQQSFVDYDELCAAPSEIGDKLGERLGAPISLKGLRRPSIHATVVASPTIVKEAYALHDRLRSIAGTSIANVVSIRSRAARARR